MTEAWKLITDPNNPNFAVVREYLVEDDISKLDIYARIVCMLVAFSWPFLTFYR